MRVRRIDTGQKQDVWRFIQFPFELYKNCSMWVPPLLSGARRDLNRRKHPFYRHSTADFFVAESEGQVVGRIAALYNANYNRYRGTRIAFFGFFEAIEDLQVVRALFGAVRQWAHQLGVTQIVGPKGLIGVDGSGVLVEGFEHQPALGVPYNFPYYDAFIQDSGFEKESDYLSGYVRGDYQLPERFYQVAEKVKARNGFWVQSFRSRQEMRRWAPRVVEAHHAAFSQNHTFYPPTAEEIALIADTVIGVADPRLVKLIMKGKQIAGFIFAYQDISAALKKCKGRLWPLGWLSILQERKRTRRVNANGVGLLPAYRGMGANAVLYTELAQSIYAFNFEHVEVIQVEEGNFKSRADMEAIGVQWYKRHRSYQCAL